MNTTKDTFEVIAAVLIVVVVAAFGSWCLGYWFGEGMTKGLEKATIQVTHVIER